MKLGWDFKTNAIDESNFTSIEEVINFIIDDSCWRFRSVVRFELDHEGNLHINYKLPQHESFPFLEPGLNKVDYAKLSYDAQGAADWDTGRFVL